LESHFRCKCGRLMAYSNEPCKNCGSLGPHTFIGNTAPESDNNANKTVQHRDLPISRSFDNPPPINREDKHPFPKKPDMPSEPEIPVHIAPDKNDSTFPAGMRTRSPILDHIQKLDNIQEETQKKKKRKEEKYNDVGSTGTGSAKSFIDLEEIEGGEKREKQTAGKKGNSTAVIISLILIILLLIGTVYVINNFEEITKWLAAPTVPLFPKPDEGSSEGQSGLNPAQKAGDTGSVATSGTLGSPVNQNQSPNTSSPAGVSSDTQAPVISGLVVKSITDSGAVISWKTDEPCTSKIIYRAEVGDSTSHNVSVRPALSHSITITGLESGKNYFFTIQCQDEAGNITKLDGQKFQTLAATADITPPQLVGLPTVSADDTSASISWATNEKAVSMVNYGISSAYEFKSGKSSELKLSHSIFISGLSPDTTYHYQLVSTDQAGNTMTSTDFTFRTEPPSDAAPYVGSKAPNFTLTTLEGKETSLYQYRGKKVILNFWASWCSPCKVEFPHLQSIWEKYKNSSDVVVLTVAGGESDENEIRSYIANNNYTLTVCLDSSESTFNRYDITSVPKTFFLDKNGVIRRVQQGMFTSPSEIDFVLSSY